MKHKLYAFILTISLAFIFSGCVAVENPVEAVIDNTSENLNETESETIAETTETTSSELITLDTSTDITSMQSSDSATTTITESKPLPESLELSLYKDLTQEDIELFRPYKELMLHISEENIDISLLAQLDSLKKLTIYRNGYPGVYYNGEPTSYASDFSFLNGMNLTELDIECGKTKLCLNEIKLENLESLTINYADIIISDELLNFPALKELSLRYSDINSIDPFCDLRLETLNLYCFDTEQINIDIINKMESLSNLDIFFCNNIELTTLRGLINLKTFSLLGSKIKYSVDIIFDLTSLEKCFIYFEFITDEQAQKFRELNPMCDFYVVDTAR